MRKPIWVSEADLERLKQELDDAVAGRGLAEERRMRERVYTDPCKRKCLAIRLATWALLYRNDYGEPEEDGAYSENDASPTAKEAAERIDSLRRDVREHLLGEQEAVADVAFFERRAELARNAIAAILTKRNHKQKTRLRGDENGGSLL